MPLENELKFILNLKFEKDIKPYKLSPELITQSYLSKDVNCTVRLREVKSKYGSDYYLTVKSRESVFDRTTEIETEISSSDYETLVPRTTNIVIKSRYNFSYNDYVWNVDMFTDCKSKPYLIIAEVEYTLEQGQPKKKDIPDVIKNNILFECPEFDTRFNNIVLSETAYCKRIYELAKKKQL